MTYLVVSDPSLLNEILIDEDTNNKNIAILN